MVWYLAGIVDGPPPTSINFCRGDDAPRSSKARFRASSRDKSFVGVEMARDFGRHRFGEPVK